MIQFSRKFLVLILVGLLASHATPALAQQVARRPAAVPVRTILFVGNSFFHGKYQPVLAYNTARVTDENYGLPATNPRCETTTGEPVVWGGIPGIFQQFTEEAGLNYEVHFEEMNARPLQYHYEHALAIIQQARWHTVVLQEHSQWALPPGHGGHPELFRDYATRLEQAVHAANPAASVLLFQTWPRADLTYPADKPFSGQPLDSMAWELHASYYGLLAQNPGFKSIAPAGDAWLRAVQAGLAQRNPYAPEPDKIDLWAEDYYHPSNWGAYLTACVLFGEITGYDPRALGGTEQAAAALGVSPTEAVALQRVAAEQVRAARPEAFAETPVSQGKPAPPKIKVKVKS
ncbi:MAG: PEP-CTERM sorting domain-containing protein [Bacteroidota bacterium]|nr:PEP-CTERM sorting domain-containing protein [Bacteroidota bacterium]